MSLRIFSLAISCIIEHIKGMHSELIKRIESYCASNGISVWEFGQSLGNRMLVARLRKGGDITMTTFRKIEARLITGQNQ